MSGYPATIVVDVANVMGSRPDGWWRDRAGAAVRLHAGLARLAASGQPLLPEDVGSAVQVGKPDDGGQPDDRSLAEDRGSGEGGGPPEFVMVLEGAAKAAAARIGADPSSRVRVVQANGSGDDAIVALVRELRGAQGSGGRVIVVTADRELRRRCEAAGATVLGPSWLLGLLDRA